MNIRHGLGRGTVTSHFDADSDRETVSWTATS